MVACVFSTVLSDVPGSFCSSRHCVHLGREFLLFLWPLVADSRRSDGVDLCTALCSSVCSCQDVCRWKIPEQGKARSYTYSTGFLVRPFSPISADLSFIRHWLNPRCVSGGVKKPRRGAHTSEGLTSEHPDFRHSDLCCQVMCLVSLWERQGPCDCNHGTVQSCWSHMNTQLADGAVCE